MDFKGKVLKGVVVNSCSTEYLNGTNLLSLEAD